MLRPVEMVRFTISVPRDKCEEAIEIIGKLGTAHLIKEYTVAGYKGTKSKELDNILSEINQNTTRKEELEKYLDVVKFLADLGLNPGRIRKSELLFIKIYEFPTKILDKLPRYLEGTGIIYKSKEIDSNRSFVLSTGLKGNSKLMDNIAKILNGKEITLPEEVPDDSEEAKTKIANEIRDVSQKINRILKNISLEIPADSSTEYSSMIKKFASKIAKIEEAKASVTTTVTRAVIRGWIPKKDLDVLKRSIQEKIVEANIIINKPTKDEIPPSVIDHKYPVSSFQLITSLLGAPRYRTIDPTIPFTILYPLTYGIMFGDIGQGLILTLLAIYSSKKVEGTLKKIAGMGTMCGISSIIFGFVYGEFFQRRVIHPMIEPLEPEGILSLFKLALAFGIIQIFLGLSFNVINKVALRDIVDAFMGQFGIAGMVLYASGILLVIKSNMRIENFTRFPTLLSAAVVAIVLIFLSPTIRGIVEGKPKFGYSLFEGFAGAIESILSSLTNTASYLRIAAFSISHAALGELGAQGIIALLGSNALAFLIEAMVVGIQSTRLIVYEFSMKFYIKGEKYEPFKLY